MRGGDERLVVCARDGSCLALAANIALGSSWYHVY